MRAEESLLSQTLLMERMHYSPSKGQFRRIRHNSAGEPIGFGRVIGGTKDPDNRNYGQIRINGIPYHAHRLAWIYMTGKPPTGVIDHIDGNKSNNAFNNLRDITYAQNLQNIKKAPRNSSTQILGITQFRGKYLARIRVDGRQIHLGSYPTKEEAHHAYITAKRELHPACTI